MPRVTALIFGAAGRAFAQRSRGGATSTLALARLANAPGHASIAMGGVLSSFALIVAMAIMVASFRVSVEDWLEHLLSADLYVRVAPNGDTGGLSAGEQSLLAAVPGISKAAFARTSRLTLDAARPDVALLARETDAADPGANLQMTGAVLRPSDWRNGEMPVWVSEAMVDLYGYKPGQRVQLPLGAARTAFSSSPACGAITCGRPARSRYGSPITGVSPATPAPPMSP